MPAFFVSLEPRAITDEVIVDCARIAKVKDVLASIGVIDLANEMLPSYIVDDPRFWNLMVKI